MVCTSTTIEGFDNDPTMTALRAAFTQEHALQCGFCTPGMLITARDIVLRVVNPDEDRIREELGGNLCRCTGYVGIVRAIAKVAEERAGGLDPSKAPRENAAERNGRGFSSPEPLPASSGELTASAQHYSGSAMIAGAAVPSTGAPVASARQGETRIEQSIAVPYGPEHVWQALRNLRDVVACLPGAELTAMDDKSLQGRIQIKFGPIRANFAGEATYAFNDAARSGTMTGQGRDRLSGSLVRGELAFAVTSEAAGTSTITLSLTFVLQGMLAHFARSSLVNDFIARTIAIFAANLSARIRDGEGPAPRGATNGGEFEMGALIWRVLWSRLKGLFGRWR